MTSERKDKFAFMQNRISRPKSIPAGHGLCIELNGEARRLILGGEETAGSLSLFHSRFQFGSGTPTHAHTREDKWFWVERGQFDFHLGDECFSIGKGDFVFAPTNLLHSYTCTDENGGDLVVGAMGFDSSRFFNDLAAYVESEVVICSRQLQTIGAKNGIQFGNFELLEALTSRPCIMRSNQGENVEAFGDRGRFLVDSAYVQNRFCIMTGQTPSLSGPPLHIHHREDETFYILAGRYEFLVEDARLQVEAGDVVWAPRGVPHTFRVVSNEAGHCLTLCTPGGFDNFFRECVQLFQRGVATPDNICQIGLAHQIGFIPQSA